MMKQGGERSARPVSQELSAQPSAHVMENIDRARKTTQNGKEFWYARELRPLLGYDEWRNFENAIERAKASCKAYGQEPKKHFVEVDTMVEVGMGAKRKQKDYFLSRYACRLIAMNGDTTKVAIASAQAYFLAQTHRMEATDRAAQDYHRLGVRARLSKSVTRLSKVAQEIGVERFPIFHAARWHRLYGKDSMKAIREAKGVPEGEDILNRLGAWELSIHDFQVGLTTRRILNEGVTGEDAATAVNGETAQTVRDTIIANLGHGPEDVPIEESIQDVSKRLRAQRKAKALPSPSE